MTLAMRSLILAGSLAAGWCAKGATRTDSASTGTATGLAAANDDTSSRAIAEGQRVFRFETFGDAQFWTAATRSGRIPEVAVSVWFNPKELR